MNPNTRYEEIVNVASIGKPENPILLNEILPKANAEKLTPADKNKEEILLLAIDYQQDFMDNGALGVGGAIGDVERATRFIYNNMDKITKIAYSLDTHAPIQIFHPCWWVDAHGNNPAPFTAITLADLDAGKWLPVVAPIASRKYIQELEKTGKKVLVTWTYHCLQGTTGGALENQFANMMYFHSVAKKSMVIPLVKGNDPLSEMYGVIKPEYSEKVGINTNFLNLLSNAATNKVVYSKIVIVGEAKSHCCLESIYQILDFFANAPDVTKKVYILEDCMSSIAGCEVATDATFADFKKKYGVNIVKSTDLVL